MRAPVRRAARMDHGRGRRLSQSRGATPSATRSLGVAANVNSVTAETVPAAALPAAPLALRAPRARPREKLKDRGAGALSDGDLLALVIGSGCAGRSASRIGLRLARHAPAELAAWPIARWARVPGIGTARAAALAAAFELGRRAVERPARSEAIRGPEDVRVHVRDLFRARKEHFVVLLLNARHEMQARETVSIGSLNASIVHPREVFQPAILHSAASVVLVHNHPSGDPEPSEEDLSITRRLVQVGELVGIGVLDHVIVAARGLVSLRARQLL
jgi:DNA repair protein RadC